ncbi:MULTISPECIES: hypothetical protein [unclassified Streptomyces]|uniref:hypothetical protein n=1 Tax=unclassified Streptomyces TaxID=2593676 RepID=UPI00081F1A0A|nr:MULTISPECIES: hypothetical protein [unclassified Streptomyces]MYZ39530.1 hypothetical protein [Streptomyces sp. SID4917]SCG04160.1 hypothetical protein GA0115259_108738 [Streptomyces sp. MnatMP-M17]
MTSTTHYGKAVATAWDRLHPLLVRRSAWADYPEGELPVIEGTVAWSGTAGPEALSPIGTELHRAAPGMGCGHCDDGH